jgi:protease-4
MAMPLDADVIVDRRRMRRKLTFWRVSAIVVAIVAVAVLVTTLTPIGKLTGSGNYIARIRIQGLIRGNQDRIEALERLGRSSALGVIVHVDTPGGTTAGSEQLYDSLRWIQARKPVVAVVDGMAASGGYITVIAADHIVSQETSLVGSIGVLFQYPNFTEALKTLGIKVESIKSSPLKAAPSGFEPTSPEAREAIASIIRDSYDWFRRLVKERRQLDDAQLAKVADGRIFTGRQALELRLVDALGDERTARAWLAKNKNIPITTPVRDVSLQPRLSELSFLHVAVWALQALGLGPMARRIQEWGGAATIERLNLDGLLALWHPSVSD